MSHIQVNKLLYIHISKLVDMVCFIDLVFTSKSIQILIFAERRGQLTNQ